MIGFGYFGFEFWVREIVPRASWVCLGWSMSCIGGMLLYTFMSSYDKITNFIKHKFRLKEGNKYSIEPDEYLFLPFL